MLLYEMLVSYTLLLSASIASLVLGRPTTLGKRTVSADVLDDLVLYTKYSSAVESIVTLLLGTCPKPLNSTLVQEVF